MNKLNNISILYIEPLHYYSSKKDSVLNRRSFDLSKEVNNFSGLPGNLLNLSKDRATKILFLLGFEGSRLDQAMEQLFIDPNNVNLLFGVPAYNAGWETNSYSNNIGVIKERFLTGPKYFAAANCPIGTYRIISKLYRSCNYSLKERFMVIPIGTKPQAIGAALFACTNDDIGVSYDNPIGSPDRSLEVGKCHLVDAFFND